MTQTPDIEIRRNWMSSGLLCATVRGPLGNINGYVCVPPGHPWHGVAYNERLCGDDCPERSSLGGDDTYCWDHVPDGLIDVHGGLTFSGDGVDWLPSEGGWWFGFDTAHSGDLVPGLTLRFGDEVERDDAYVEMHCDLLALQLGAVTERLPSAPLLTHEDA